MPEIKIGDVVMLNSGGPLMTVIGKVTSDECFICKWWDINHAAFFKEKFIDSSITTTVLPPKAIVYNSIPTDSLEGGS
jgi:uncharacterized protein YodC (DUF2158 family)